MSDKLLFPFPGNEVLGSAIAEQLNCPVAQWKLACFPDGESYVRLETDVTGKEVILICSLNQPNTKTLDLLFLADTAKELGAKQVGLVAPYLAYMRQDKRFKDGEAITSELYARLLSEHFDWLVTVDPHLHRHTHMAEIYSIPTRVVHTAQAIGDWIESHVNRPLLIGPDSESEQWVSEVAALASAPYVILEKVRHGDRDVEISIPELEGYQDHTPVLVDDIISTARTMIETTRHLKHLGLQPPVCIGVHAVFAGDGYEALSQAGPAQIITCNTIPHPSNGIDIIMDLSAEVSRLSLQS
jgi:ribose-phosphate pyrophosphokinase